MSKETGGPAFPLHPSADSRYNESGMTLRDYFAAKVLQGMAARDAFDSGQATPDQRARLAYIDADAMLKARKQ